MEIDINLARKVLQVVDAGLVSGMGTPTPGNMCVEAAVCYAMGLPHGDKPTCVAPALRSLKIRLNDSLWSSDVARSKGLRRLALAQLGSDGVLDEKEFVRRVSRLAIQTQVPAALRAAASICKNLHKDKLLTMAALCEREPTEKNSRDARQAALEARDQASGGDQRSAVVTRGGHSRRDGVPRQPAPPDGARQPYRRAGGGHSRLR